MKFQRLSAKLKYNNETLLNDLQHKISSDLQRVMINEQNKLYYMHVVDMNETMFIERDKHERNNSATCM